MTFDEIARELGIKPKALYPVGEVARIMGIPYSTLLLELKAGRLKSTLPAGRKRGRLIRPEWVDEWVEEGCGS